jgi:flagellar hook-associated protein 1
VSSTFYGLEIAKTGLFASQQSINLTGHNIANANTAGYTRQRLAQSSIEVTSGSERFAAVTKGFTGGGVRSDGIEQIRSDFLDRQYRTENGTQQMWSTKSDAMGYIEKLFNETDDSGLSTTINDFFVSLQTLSTNPESPEYRTNVMQNAMKMTDDFQHYASQLADKQSEINDTVKVTVSQINDAAQNIADLNNEIFRYEINGEKANDLRDKRNTLLDTLSGIADISYSEDADGQVSVDLGGKTLVSGQTVHQLQTSATQTNNISGGITLNAVSWADYTEADGSASPLVVSSGSLKGYLDIRDGNTTDNVGIPELMSQLDTLASTIATQFNAIHSAGYTLPDSSNGNTSSTGVNFFTVPASGTITAANISVDSAIQSNVDNIAASGVEITSTTLMGNNTNALALANLQNKTDIPTVGSIESYLKGFISGIGVTAAHANTMLDNEESLVDNLVNQKTSVSGVSTDEELTNLIKYQHSYSASARVITAIDEALDVIINKMGLVGR